MEIYQYIILAMKTKELLTMDIIIQTEYHLQLTLQLDKADKVNYLFDIQCLYNIIKQFFKLNRLDLTIDNNIERDISIIIIDKFYVMIY